MSFQESFTTLTVVETINFCAVTDSLVDQQAVATAWRDSNLRGSDPISCLHVLGLLGL